MTRFYNTMNQEITENIGKIVIYGNGKILYQIEQGYFDVKTIGENENGEAKLKDGFYSKYDDITKIFITDPKRANKENLNRNDNYLLKWETSYGTIKKALYIHESEIKVEYIGELLSMDTKEEKCYLHTYKLTFKNPVEYRIKNHEKIPCDNFELPENGRFSECYGTEENPCFYPYDENESFFPSRYPNPTKGVIKKWFTYETPETSEIIVTERGYSKIIYSDERIENERIAKAINEIIGNNKLSYYDIRNIKEKYNITLTEKAATITAK